MDMECGKELTEILILENGRILKLMVMAFIYGKTEIDMRVSGKDV